MSFPAFAIKKYRTQPTDEHDATCNVTITGTKHKAFLLFLFEKKLYKEKTKIELVTASKSCLRADAKKKKDSFVFSTVVLL